jgi:predicted dehydrogenase
MARSIRLWRKVISLRKVRWGILSTARINSRLAPGMRESSLTELVGVASRELSRAEAAARELGARKAFGSYEELLASDEVDAVYISLPNSLHLEWCIKAAEAGKHVLCEKPLASNAVEAEQAVKACEKEGVLLMEAFMYRHHPQQVKVREVLSSGRIGEPSVVNARLSISVESMDDIRWKGTLAGGALMDVGCYCINASRFIYGSEPIRAKALWNFNKEKGVDQTTLGVLEFPREQFASFVCGLRMQRANQYEIIGTEGSIEATTAFVPGTVDTVIRVKDESGTEAIIVPGIDQYRLEVEHFSRAIIEDTELSYPAENGLANMKAIDLVRNSARDMDEAACSA